MRNDWMIHVLKDLRTFAELNGLDDLAAKLVETLDVARPAIAGLDRTENVGNASYASSPRDSDGPLGRGN